MPGIEPTPLGVYDHPPDPEVPGLYGVNVGGGRVAHLARDLTGLANEVADFLNSLTPGPP